ncbi:PREDICTED: 60S ribosomal [Prunus dulcis]|uniref:PREDICTED: 60S ribosomal n=1 Tax=Prunus dulcis TaxID=3755 RepID=A0A5E4G0D4_PRUDU|nr:PREDICTED: 60S ribosomal [Prunus dulcis]
MLTDFEGATRKNEVGFCIWTSKEFHQWQVVGRKLPTASDEYFLRKLKKVKKSNGQVLAINEVT